MSQTQWRSYEQVAHYLLNQMASEFGLRRVEGKQTIRGSRSGTAWEIEAKGVRIGEGEGFIIVECRRYTTSKQRQEQMGGLAYRILDTGAAGGILVSPLGLQEGAAKVAGAENIQTVILSENSTTTNYLLQFLNIAFLGVTDQLGPVVDTATVKVIPASHPKTEE
jgi:2-polyprenyl-3-methyl-5-hydroxy-6-metoxy-1,4-benzoquinol methylase